VQAHFRAPLLIHGVISQSIGLKFDKLTDKVPSAQNHTAM